MARYLGVDVGAVEITLDSPGALATIELLARRFEGRAHVGDGTVLDEATVRAGRESGTPLLPSVFTATEPLTAPRPGFTAVKLFAAGPVGPGHVKALRGSIADVAIVPTGGIGRADVRAYRDAGVPAVDLGRALTNVSPERIGAVHRQNVHRALVADDPVSLR